MSKSEIRIPKSAIRQSGHVFVISGPSGGGKTTLVERLLRTVPALTRSVSVTTRAKRPGERQGRDYRFVSAAEFHRLKRAGALLEWARVHHADYGTPTHPVQRALAQGRSVVLSIDVQGARHIRRALGPQAVLVFLLPPSLARLRQRLIQRNTDTPAAIHRRMRTATREIACAAWYDHTVVNDRLSTAVRRIVHIMKTHERTLSVEQRKG